MNYHSPPPQNRQRMSQSPYYQNQGRPPQGQGPVRPRMPQNQYQQPQRKPQRPKGRGLRIVVYVALLAALIGIGYLVYSGVQHKKVQEAVAPYQNIYGDNIYINDVNISRMTPEQALVAVTNKMHQSVHSWSLDIEFNGWKYFTFTYPSLGINYSDEQFYPFLNDAWALTHTGDVYQRLESIQHLQQNPYKVYTTQQELNDGNIDQLLSQIADLLNREPVDAALLEFRPDDRQNPFYIRPEQQGMTVNVEEAKAAILEMAATGQSGTYQIPVTYTEPAVRVADVEKKVTLRAEASTAISKDSTEKRTSNIRQSLTKINGLILKPGDVFSFNKVVGERTLENGYLEAVEYVSGNLETGIGGGICQTSTTLYQAALLGDLGIVRRSIHSMPVNYTEKGLDATVYLSRDHEIDFRFKNTTSSPIYITAHVHKGSSSRNLACTIRFYGEPIGEGITRRLKSVIDQVLIAEDKMVPDRKQEHVTYKDETQLISKGRDGYVVSTFLQTYQGGKLVEEKLISTDTYNPRPDEYWQGTLDR